MSWSGLVDSDCEMPTLTTHTGSVSSSSASSMNSNCRNEVAKVLVKRAGQASGLRVQLHYGLHELKLRRSSST
eukprot:scaffold65992_cov19-Tisochrysis_lutea.AAC.2